MGFFSAVKAFFRGDKKKPEETGNHEPTAPFASGSAEESVSPVPVEAVTTHTQTVTETDAKAAPQLQDEAPSPQGAASNVQDEALILALRQAEPKLSAWLDVILTGVTEADDLFRQRLALLLNALETPPAEAQAFADDLQSWLNRMDYRYLEDFRSELQYRLALALDMEDEEDERDRLFLKLQTGLARTRERLAQPLAALFAGHSSLSAEFWEEMEELFIMADMGAEPARRLVDTLRNRADKEGVDSPDGLIPLLEAEVEALFRAPRRITAFNAPEVALMVGVNGVGKTTTIAKLACRARMQGKKVLIAAADTFRAAAVEQLGVWAERTGADFHSGKTGADPASVAYGAMDKALSQGHDLVFIDTAGRLHTKSNLMDELRKIRDVVGKKHPGAPHRTILVIDATTGQNALQQAKMFKETCGVDEIILTKLDGTAKGGVALAVAAQMETPITFVGLGEKMEDLRPFDPHNFARALLGRTETDGH